MKNTMEIVLDFIVRAGAVVYCNRGEIGFSDYLFYHGLDDFSVYNLHFKLEDVEKIIITEDIVITLKEN